MATNLLRAGFDLIVHDVEPAAVDELAGAGARRAGSLEDLGRECDVIEIAVWDDAGVESVVLGDDGADGVLGCSRPGTIIVVHSTIGMELCRKLGDAAHARGASALDAAMSGGEVRAASGDLAIMVGGDADDFARCQPIFDVIGSEVFHTGPLGAGMAAKLCNNLMVLANLEAVTEALGIASAAGIDTATMIELGSAGTADSWALRHGFELQQRAAASAAADAALRMQIKDLALAAKLARELHVDAEPKIAEFFGHRAQRRFDLMRSTRPADD
jgi:3-hydroxyisobutyrate dehydrogenase-like beta-hydroxyacid dehydrogenase